MYEWAVGWHWKTVGWKAGWGEKDDSDPVEEPIDPMESGFETDFFAGAFSFGTSGKMIFSHVN